MPTPVVAIVGRPNVGKSTLFNRLVGRREAIVSDLPGTTRDRLLASITWDGRSLILIDTGGLDPHSEDPLVRSVGDQVASAMRDADVVIFLLDGQEGITPLDEDVAQQLRRLNKPLVVAVNKVDTPRQAANVAEFHTLGMGDPVALSAYHNTGVYDLMDRVVALLPEEGGEEVRREGELRLAIVGRPNVGKSMLVNAILGQERAIVSEIPGTTRDALDTLLEYKGKPVVLIDTAGIRRRGRIEMGVEKYSVLRAFQAVERADITVLVLDVAELVASQDAHIAGLAWESGKGTVLAVNKWDLAPNLQLDKARAEQLVRQGLHFMPYAPLLFVSALTRLGIEELMDVAISLHEERCQQVDPNKLHSVLMEAVASHAMPRQGRRSLRVYGARQTAINPPTFAFTVNDPNLVHFSYQRYLENRLRQGLGFPRTHLKLVFNTRARRRAH